MEGFPHSAIIWQCQGNMIFWVIKVAQFEISKQYRGSVWHEVHTVRNEMNVKHEYLELAVRNWLLVMSKLSHSVEGNEAE